MKTFEWFSERVGIEVFVITPDSKTLAVKVLNQSHVPWLFKSQEVKYCYSDIQVQSPNVCIACEG